MAHTYRMTVLDLVRYLHQQVVTTLTVQDEHTLGSLSTTLMELAEVAQHYGDLAVYEVLDDLRYAVNETLMGAPGKRDSALAGVPAKLAQLAAAETQP